MIKVGLIGFSKFNGHPFSFSGIINGINESYFKKNAGWPYIYSYLKQNKKKLKFKKMRVSHVWTQNIRVTKKISKSCLIENICSNPKQMINKVDAIIIARDDWKSHYKIAIPFLKKKIPTFIDKPLTLNNNEIKLFSPYLKKNILMSCSGLRFSSKVLNFKKKIKTIGKIKKIEAFVLNDFEKYGVHMLDIINELLDENFKNIYNTVEKKDFFKITSQSNIKIELKCLGRVKKIFDIYFYGTKKKLKLSIDDNFDAFYNTLKNFEKMIKNKKEIISYQDTLNIMNTIIAGNKSRIRKIDV